MAGDRLRRGPDQPGRALRAPPGAAGATARRGPRLSLQRDEGRRRRVQGGARRAPRLPRRRRGQRRRAPARSRRGRERRPRRHPRRRDVRPRAPRRPGHRARRRHRPLQLRGRRRRHGRADHARRPRRGPSLQHAPASCSCSKALGAEPPIYAHLPLLHGADGKKLSKRHGAASVQEFRDMGYLPEALNNYLALLGWGAEDDETILSADELRSASRSSASPGTRRSSIIRSCAGSTAATCARCRSRT